MVKPSPNPDLRVCLTALFDRGIKIMPFFKTYPFLRYAGKNWCLHADQGKLRDEFNEFGWVFNPTSPIFRRWIELNDTRGGLAFDTIGDGILQMNPMVGGLMTISYVAAYGGFRHLLTLALQKRPQDKATTLVAASFAGHINVVESLLKDPDLQEKGVHLAPLAWISVCQHPHIISLLLDAMEATFGPDYARLGETVAVIRSCIEGALEALRIVIPRYRDHSGMEFARFDFSMLKTCTKCQLHDIFSEETKNT